MILFHGFELDNQERMRILYTKRLDELCTLKHDCHALLPNRNSEIKAGGFRCLGKS